MRVEQDALDALRKKMRVVCADAEAERKFNASNKRKLKNNQEPAEKHKVRRVVTTLEILESDVE